MLIQKSFVKCNFTFLQPLRRALYLFLLSTKGAVVSKMILYIMTWLQKQTFQHMFTTALELQGCFKLDPLRAPESWSELLKTILSQMPYSKESQNRRRKEHILPSTRSGQARKEPHQICPHILVQQQRPKEMKAGRSCRSCRTVRDVPSPR